MSLPQFARRLPSIRGLLLVGGLLLLVPLLFTTGIELIEADQRVDASTSATESADRLGVLLRLAPAIRVETNASVSAMGSEEIPAEIPPFILATVGLDFEAALTDSREVVDQLLAQLDDDEIHQLLADLRPQVEGAEIQQVFDGFNAAAEVIDVAIDQEVQTLTAAAVDSGRGGQLIAAVRVAEAVAAVQVAQAGLVPQWGALVAPVSAPDTSQVRQLSDGVAQLRRAARDLDVVAAGTDVGEQWRAIHDSPENRRLIARFEDAVEQFSLSGARDPAVDVPLFAENIDIDQISEAVEIIGAATADSELLAEQFDVLVDTALSQVNQAATDAADEARLIRNRTLGWAVGFGMVLVLLGTSLFVVVVGPVRRMEAVARALRDGHLDKTADEQGPRELRIAAGVLNEAVASVRLAEQQAAALAAERLDDPVLNQSVAGRLGVSLQRTVTRLAASLAEREEFQRQLSHEASHDGLTTLPNRRAIMTHLEEALWRLSRRDTSIALLFVDLDGFREINEEHGHLVGDMVLRILSDRLLEVSRDTDLVGRMGGDEFVVVAQDLGRIEHAAAVAKRVGERLNEPITAAGVTVIPDASIGVAFTSDPAATPEELFRDADMAVAQAKLEGRGQVAVCDEDMRRHLLEQGEMEDAIRAAMDGDEFHLVFQPAIDTRTGAAMSLEALIRWDRPEVGFVSPGEFIPVAERSDLIVELDRWVLRAVARQIAAWQSHPGLSGIPVAVNISGRHVGNGTLAKDVRAVLDEFYIEPQSLMIEVTETAVLDDERGAAQQLTALRSMGVKIALDDFGTGYMSLAHLRSLPVDTLKIDRSFVAKMEESTDRSLVELMVNTGHLLGLSVTAEGIETQEEADGLTELGADALQGFLLCKPIVSDELERRLQGQTALVGPLSVTDTWMA
ncbi:putative bifunctional diguanylate cyclase/phosphodiesterase [Euzebya tangerina]|uniref:putative bifunctional diguanylate cyclase/phosphodiesterase n=1 Tax=Euzebya tangerina TaxID=591198 RepID=UPI000E30B85D|nr:EAL domain-containing protein [Euzebya tangerina]